VFESLFAYRIAMMSLDDDRGAHRVWGYLATGNDFESLGIKPALGRFFTPAEDTHPNASPSAVLSYACWQSRFAADPQNRRKRHPHQRASVYRAGSRAARIPRH